MGGTFGKSGSWVLDHTMDNIPLSPYGMDKVGHGSIVNGFENTAPPPYEEIVSFTETPQEKKNRKRSQWIAYLTVFVMSIGFSIVLTSVWPYLQSINKDLTKNALGFVVAANPLGQLLASPLLGLWGNKAGKIRGACLITVIFFILGNAMYSLLALFEHMGRFGPYYAMIVSRFIVGMSSANVTLCRSYLAQSTTLEERTSSIAILAAAQALGFVFGPAIQTVLVIIVPQEVETGIWWLRWNEFTAAGWTASILGLINLVLLMPVIFTEYNIAEKEMALLMEQESKDETLKLPNPNPLSLAGLLFGFFISVFIYVLIETLAVPFVSDQYGWTGNTPQILVGVALMGAGLLATVIFPITGWLSRRFDERLVMLIPGFIPIILGVALFLPYPGHKIPIQKCFSNTSDETSPSTSWESSTWAAVSNSWEVNTDSDLLLLDQQLPIDSSSILERLLLLSSTVYENNEECTGGCPTEQEWCLTVPQLPLPQLAVAFLIVMSGYPVVQSIVQGLYSKMLGPRPQGLWMGVLTGVGSLARIAGPIFVSYIYTEFGTYWCFGIILVGMLLALVELIVMYRHLIPMKIPVLKAQYAYDGPAANP